MYEARSKGWRLGVRSTAEQNQFSFYLFSKQKAVIVSQVHEGCFREKEIGQPSPQSSKTGYTALQNHIVGMIKLAITDDSWMGEGGGWGAKNITFFVSYLKKR